MNYEVDKEEVLDLLLSEARQEIDQLKAVNAQLRIILTRMQKEQQQQEQEAAVEEQ